MEIAKNIRGYFFTQFVIRKSPPPKHYQIFWKFVFLLFRNLATNVLVHGKNKQTKKSCHSHSPHLLMCFYGNYTGENDPGSNGVISQPLDYKQHCLTRQPLPQFLPFLSPHLPAQFLNQITQSLHSYHLDPIPSLLISRSQETKC